MHINRSQTGLSAKSYWLITTLPFTVKVSVTLPPLIAIGSASAAETAAPRRENAFGWIGCASPLMLPRLTSRDQRAFFTIAQLARQLETGTGTDNHQFLLRQLACQRAQHDKVFALQDQFNAHRPAITLALVAEALAGGERAGLRGGCPRGFGFRGALE